MARCVNQVTRFFSNIAKASDEVGIERNGENCGIIKSERGAFLIKVRNAAVKPTQVNSWNGSNVSQG